MEMSKKRIDIGQLNIFDLIKEISKKQSQSSSSSISEKSSVDATLRSIISDSLKHSPLSRWEVAGKMSEILGTEITKSQIDSWSAESKDGHRFPLIYIDAFCRASGDKSLIHYICRLCGGYFIEGQDTLKLELGRIQEKREEIQQVEEELQRREQTIREFLQSLKNKEGGKS
jgi:hypothetical protein